MHPGKKGKEIITRHKYDISSPNHISNGMLSKVTDSDFNTELIFFGYFVGLSYLAYSTDKF